LQTHAAYGVVQVRPSALSALTWFVFWPVGFLIRFVIVPIASYEGRRIEYQADEGVAAIGMGDGLIRALERRGGAGIDILWPVLGDPDHESALDDAAASLPPNNISCIAKYSLQEGVDALWMGDLDRFHGKDRGQDQPSGD
jgi:Zn-dependent protease with chaperone function